MPHYAITEPHIFTITPDSSQWADLDPRDRLDACRVDEDEVRQMTTEALAETVINYPFMVNIFAYEGLEPGFYAVSSYFPGIPELIKRDDAVVTLERYLEQYPEKSYKYSLIHTLIEYIRQFDFMVEITLPPVVSVLYEHSAPYYYAEKNGFYSVVFHEDGAITTCITRSRQQRLSLEFSSHLDLEFSQLRTDAPSSFVSAHHSSDYRRITIEVCADEYIPGSLNLSSLISHAMLYQASCGEEVKVEVMIQADGKLLETQVYTEIDIP